LDISIDELVELFSRGLFLGFISVVIFCWVLGGLYGPIIFMFFLYQVAQVVLFRLLLWMFGFFGRIRGFFKPKVNRLVGTLAILLLVYGFLGVSIPYDSLLLNCLVFFLVGFLVGFLVIWNDDDDGSGGGGF